MLNTADAVTSRHVTRLFLRKCTDHFLFGSLSAATLKALSGRWVGRGYLFFWKHIKRGLWNEAPKQCPPETSQAELGWTTLPSRAENGSKGTGRDEGTERRRAGARPCRPPGAAAPGGKTPRDAPFLLTCLRLHIRFPSPPSHHLRVADKPRLRRTRPNCEAAPSLPRSPRRVRPQSSRRRPSPRRLPHWAAPFSGARTHPQPPWAPAQHRPGTD